MLLMGDDTYKRQSCVTSLRKIRSMIFLRHAKSISSHSSGGPKRGIQNKGPKDAHQPKLKCCNLAKCQQISSPPLDFGKNITYFRIFLADLKVS